MSALSSCFLLSSRRFVALKVLNCFVPSNDRILLEVFPDIKSGTCYFLLSCAKVKTTKFLTCSWNNRNCWGNNILIIYNPAESLHFHLEVIFYVKNANTNVFDSEWPFFCKFRQSKKKMSLISTPWCLWQKKVPCIASRICNFATNTILTPKELPNQKMLATDFMFVSRQLTPCMQNLESFDCPFLEFMQAIIHSSITLL